MRRHVDVGVARRMEPVGHHPMVGQGGHPLETGKEDRPIGFGPWLEKTWDKKAMC